MAARRFPTRYLTWHYRSRHESLIAVSNHEFYDNRLLIYPSAVSESEHLGLQLIHVSEGVYDRGGSGVNRVEAKRVAAAAVQHFRKFPTKSLGIGTFGIKQQQAILEEIELLWRQNPDLEEFFTPARPEHFFVKNLETIQGDERDFIYISVGYGRDSRGTLSRNFGPLNQEGGERRLNVLITRARERCVVFSNFRGQDLLVDPGAARGLLALKTFLEFAESHRLPPTSDVREDSDSPFEDEVYDVLEKHGHTVRRQVGCAGFRVDLAIVDPESPGRYLIGIECDGAKYHSSLVARDRDRLRQQILEGMGWVIHRVWSTDWYRRRAASVDRLLKAVDTARSTRERREREALERFRTRERIAVRAESGEKVAPAVALSDPLLQIPEYRICESTRLAVAGELHLVPPSKMLIVVEDVVGVEGPIHFEELVRRIRTLWGVGRAGDRIREAVEKGATAAVRNGNVRRHGDFYWPARVTIAPLRRRRFDPPAKIEHICDEELAEALTFVLRTQYATPQEELITQASRALGILATRQGTAERIRRVISKLVVGEQLSRNGEGVIGLNSESS